MRRLSLGVALVAFLAISAVAFGVTPGPTIGYPQRVVGVDGGSIYVTPGPGNWDSRFGTPGTCTSTGTSNNGQLRVTPGAYLRGNCITAAYAGAASQFDGGTQPTCLSLDGGSNFSCPPRQAGRDFFIRLRPTDDSVACVSASGTAYCLFWEASN